MKQIYPITVAVLVTITMCCSAIGVRPAKKSPVHATISQTTALDTTKLASAE